MNLTATASFLASSNSSESTVFQKMTSRDYATKFNYLTRVFERTIDINASIERKSATIMANILPELDRKRNIFSNLQEQLTEIAENEVNEYDIDSCRVTYMPLLKFLLLLPHEVIVNSCRNHRSNTTTLNESVDDQFLPDEVTEAEVETFRQEFERRNQFELVFNADCKYYYKTEKMRQLDDTYGDLALEIKDLESEILEHLQKCFIKYSHYYADLIELTSELDVLLSFALTAQENDFRKPKFNPDAGSYIFAKQVCSFTFSFNSKYFTKLYWFYDIDCPGINR